MSKHTPEPWRVRRVQGRQNDIEAKVDHSPNDDEWVRIAACEVLTLHKQYDVNMANAAHIVACVNALAGIDPAKVNGLRSAVLHYQRNPCAATLHEAGRLAVKFFGMGPQPKASSNEDSYRKAEATYAFHAHYDHLQAGVAALTAGEAALAVFREREGQQRFRWLGVAEMWMGKATFEIQSLSIGGDEILARDLTARALKLADEIEAYG